MIPNTVLSCQEKVFNNKLRKKKISELVLMVFILNFLILIHSNNYGNFEERKSAMHLYSLMLENIQPSGVHKLVKSMPKRVQATGTLKAKGGHTAIVQLPYSPYQY